MDLRIDQWITSDSGLGSAYGIQSPSVISLARVYGGFLASPSFKFGYFSTGKWSPFTEPGKRYQVQSFADLRAYWNVVLPITVPLGQGGSVSIDPNNYLPGKPGRQGYPLNNTRPWSPECKDRKNREWSSPDGKCVCKQGEPRDRPDCNPAADCPRPDRMYKDQDGQCHCMAGYPIGISIGTKLVDCRTQAEYDLELDRATDADLGAIRIDPDGDPSTYTMCTKVGHVSSTAIDPNTGNPIPGGAGTEVVFRCRTLTIPPLHREAEGPSTLSPTDRVFCFDSRNRNGWQPCEDDPFPNLPLNLPFFDFQALLPECQGSRIPEWCHRINFGSPTQGGGAGQVADLSPPYIGLMPGTPVAGDEMELHVTLTNQGGILAPNHHYRVTLLKPDGAIVVRDRYTGSLGAQRSRHLTIRGFELDYPALQEGPHSITVETDSLEEIEEAVESNNRNQLSFVVAGGPVGSQPDLRVTHVRPLDANPISGHPLELEVTVTNIGGSLASRSNTLVLATDPADHVYAESLATPALAPMASETLLFITNQAVEPGVHEIVVFADNTNEVTESDELNLAERRLAVADSGLDCLPCTSGAENAVGTEVCMSGTAGPWPGLHHVCRGVRADGTTCSNDPNNPNGWEHVGAQCPRPDTLPLGWHPNACGEPDVCEGTAAP
ncbi:MAG: CARDB domain-containing protein [Acidobacteriota bacterium]